jgi:hypothetical protein
METKNRREEDLLREISDNGSSGPYRELLIETISECSRASSPAEVDWITGLRHEGLKDFSEENINLLVAEFNRIDRESIDDPDGHSIETSRESRIAACNSYDERRKLELRAYFYLGVIKGKFKSELKSKKPKSWVEILSSRITLFLKDRGAFR